LGYERWIEKKKDDAEDEEEGRINVACNEASKASD